MPGCAGDAAIGGRRAAGGDVAGDRDRTGPRAHPRLVCQLAGGARRRARQGLWRRYRARGGGAATDGGAAQSASAATRISLPHDQGQIGRASCRERVCQYVYISVVDVSLQKKKPNKSKQ